MKTDIIARLDELAHQDKVLDHLTEFNDLVDEFNKLQSEEERQWEIKKLELIEGGEKPENIQRPVYDHLEEFKKLSSLFHDKRKIEQNEIRDKEKANFEKKTALIAALSDLIQNEENIGRAIGRFKDIQESWKEAGQVPRDKRQKIQNEFSNLIESFRYNINIYKEIKDHDLNRNLKLKQDLIEKIKGLLKLEIIKDVEEKLHALQDEWNNIGGTHQDDWEKIKGDYWDTVNKVYEKIHEFYKSRKEARVENIVKKKELIEKVKEIASKEIDSHKSWKKQTDAIIALQEEWKTVGYGPKEENKAVWKEFRAICNEFFNKKKAFYAERNDQFEGVKEKKEKLIQEVESIRDSTDWKNTAKRIVTIQKKWKDAGSAGPKYENQLWKTFRSHIDHFFNAKESHFKKSKEENQANLKAKEELISKVENYKQGKDQKKVVEDLKKFAADFAAIGHVPFKLKDKVNKAFKTAMDERYGSLDLGVEEKQKIRFESKLEGIQNANDPEEVIEKERSFIKRKIGKLKEELTKLETNMSFFANADENNPLMKSAMDNIKEKQEEIQALKTQLQLLRETEKDIFAEDEEEVEEASETTTEEGEGEAKEENE